MDINEQRRVGRTDLRTSALGFGGAPVGDLGRAPSDEDTRALLQSVWDSGTRYFDTAPFYGSGLSERRIGDFLRDKPRDSYVLSTKVGRLLVPDRAFAQSRWADPRGMPFRPEFDFSYDGIMRSYEQSLQRLGLESIDILLLHDIGARSQKDQHDKTMQIAWDGGVRAMQELKEQGAVGALGLGVNEWEVCEAFLDRGAWDCFLLAGRYTLLEQTALESFLPRCQRENVSVIIGGPLNSGILATGPVAGARYEYGPAPQWALEKAGRIEAVCKRHGVAMVAAAYAFPLAHPAVCSMIPGFSTQSELASNQALLRQAIPHALWDELRAEGLLHLDAPVPTD